MGILAYNLLSYGLSAKPEKQELFGNPVNDLNYCVVCADAKINLSAVNDTINESPGRIFPAECFQRIYQVNFWLIDDAVPDLCLCVDLSLCSCL